MFASLDQACNAFTLPIISAVFVLCSHALWASPAKNIMPFTLGIVDNLRMWHLTWKLNVGFPTSCTYAWHYYVEPLSTTVTQASVMSSLFLGENIYCLCYRIVVEGTCIVLVLFKRLLNVGIWVASLYRICRIFSANLHHNTVHA